MTEKVNLFQKIPNTSSYLITNAQIVTNYRRSKNSSSTIKIKSYYFCYVRTSNSLIFYKIFQKILTICKLQTQFGIRISNLEILYNFVMYICLKINSLVLWNVKTLRWLLNLRNWPFEININPKRWCFYGVICR